MILTAPHPFIDVHVWQIEAIRALLHGTNPYAITMPNIYGHDLFYSSGMVVNGRVQIGYPYPPLTLFLSVPGYFFGDHRYTELAAMTIAAALMVASRPGRLSAIVAAVFLLTPRIFFVLEEGWTDPLPVAMLCLVVFCAFRASKLLPYAFGLFLATKQYLILAAPLMVLLLPRPFSWRQALQFFLRAGAAAAVVTLPLMLLNVRAFFHDLIEFQALQPMRAESLSYLPIMAGKGMSTPQWLCFVMAAAALALCLWRTPRTPAGFAGSVALVFAIFFAFGKQAFCNYYFFVVGAICCAVAASEAPPLILGEGRGEGKWLNEASGGAKAGAAAKSEPS
jgi:hypothetical protein